jgi:hypothetical protein
MNGIYKTNDSFDFSKLNLLTPTITNGGNYFIKFRIDDTPLYIQPPKCKTKQGIIKAGKRFFCDLMFTNENEEFIHWMEKLEDHCRKIIYENREKWFDIELDEHDIENSFTSPLKIFKSGKYYISRTNVPMLLGNCSLKVYNENEEEVNIENIEENSDVITILELQGIKCSTKNFQIEIELKQMMVLPSKNLFESCVLRGNSQPTKKNAVEDILIPTDQVVEMSEHKESFIDDVPIFEKNRAECDILPNSDSASLSNIDEPLEKENNPFNEISVEQSIDPSNESLETIKPSSFSENDCDSTSIQPKKIDENEMYEFEFDLDKIAESESIQIKRRNEIYYELYREAKRKAKIARDLAISSYLEAKQIKNTYLLEDSEDSDMDEEEFEKSMEKI